MSAPVFSAWAKSEYNDEILENFRAKELKLPEYLLQSPQLQMRRYLVDWIALIAEERNICNTALHLAIYLLDHFMDNHDIDGNRMQLAALGSFSIACKFEERDVNVPRFSELNKIVYNSFCLQEFVQIESMLLKYFKFELYVPTAAHFVECFSTVAVSDTDFLMGQPISVFYEGPEHVHLYIKYFLDLSLQDYNFLRFRPSMVAAACIASTRVRLNFTPNWTASLEEKTRYSFDDLFQCVEIMLRANEADQEMARRSMKRKNDEDEMSNGETKYLCGLSPESDTCSR